MRPGFRPGDKRKKPKTFLPLFAIDAAIQKLMKEDQSAIKLCPVVCTPCIHLPMILYMS